MTKQNEILATQPRVIRVFVSSTFRDMQGERNYLVKFIFPQLRKLCEQRCVTWGEVDLRWGVTDEAAAEGKVLPICLEEIQRCRPYFIGLLGERYGWIPDATPPEVMEREPWLREHLHGRISVTELEIIHGVLREETMHKNAFFYFRDPGYLSRLPHDSNRADFESETPGTRTKLVQLKQRIRTAHAEGVCRLRENYRGPQELGQMILEDMTQLIDTLFPESSIPDPLDREALDHEVYAQSRERVYVGRREYFDRLNAHANGGDQPLVILGESGSGKSALLANWIAHYRRVHTDVLVLQHYIGATPYSADWAAMLRRIMGEFNRRFDIQQKIPSKPDELRSAFANSLHIASAKGRVIVILDGLNQLEDRDGAPDLVWLPPVIPPNVRLILSTLPGRSLNELKKRGWPMLHINPLDSVERKQLIAGYLAQYTKVLSPVRAERIAAMPQSANPLYLQALLEELRVFGAHERLDERIGHYLQARTIPELYERILQRYEEDYEETRPGMVRDAMAVLWAARRGLSEQELLEILGTETEPFPRAYWSPFYLVAEQSLVSRSGLIGFSHDYLREAVLRRYLPEPVDQETAHECLIDYFDSRDLCPRKIDELPWQLAQTKKWRQLQELLKCLTFLEAAWDADRYEIKAYWSQVERALGVTLVDAYRVPAQRGASTITATTTQVSTMARLFFDMGYPQDSLILWDQLIDFHRRNQNKEGLQTALANKALIVFTQGKTEDGLTLLKEQEALCRELGKRTALAACLSQQADFLMVLGELDQVKLLLKEEQQIRVETRDQRALASSLVAEGMVYEIKSRSSGPVLGIKSSEYIPAGKRETDGVEAAEIDLERLARQSQDKQQLISVLERRFRRLYGSDRLDEAAKVLDERERLCESLGHKAGLAFVFGDHADLAEKKGDLDDALMLRKKQEDCYRVLSDTLGVGVAKMGQASILAKQGEMTRATTVQKEAVAILRKMGARQALVEGINQLTIMLINMGVHDEAMDLLREQEQVSREINDQPRLATAFANQAAILDARGKKAEAVRLLKEQERICRELRDYLQLAVCLHGQAYLLYNDLNDRDNALVKCQEAISLLKGEELRSHSEALLKKIQAERPRRVAYGVMFVMAITAFGGGLVMGLQNPWLWLLGVPLVLLGIILAAAAAFACSPKVKFWITMIVSRIVTWITLQSKRHR